MTEQPKRIVKIRGQQPHVPTDLSRKQVAQFAGTGLTHKQVASLMGVSERTLEKYYQPQLDNADAQKTFDVAKNLYWMATHPEHKSSASSAIFWLKTRAGWRDTTRMELTGPDGAALQLAARDDVIPSRDLTPEQREQLRSMVVASMAKSVDRDQGTLEGQFRQVSPPHTAYDDADNDDEDDDQGDADNVDDMV